MDQTKAAIEALNEHAATITKTCRTQASRLEKRLYLDRFHRYEIAIASFAAGSLSTVLYIRLHARYWRRFPTSAHVPETYVQKQKWIKGCVTSVGDGDNFRLYHTPGIGWRWPLKFRRIPLGKKDLVDQTIHIRMAGIDAPERPNFGRPGQPYSDEALEWLKSKLEGRTIYCQLILRDQYQRIVAIPHLPPFFLVPPLESLSPLLFSRFESRCVSLRMLRAGWAEVYEQAKACYGVWGVDTFKRAEQEAKRAKRGKWKMGDQGETAAQYKAKYARPTEASSTTQPDARSKKTQDETSSGKKWLSWFKRQ